jgi:signal transduction histidine kinase
MPMKSSTARWLAWPIGGVTIALQIATLAFLYADRHAVLPEGATQWSVSGFLDIAVNIAVPVIGILLASRRPENPIGWLFLLAGIGLGLGNFGEIYGAHLLLADTASTWGRLLAWVSSWIWPIPTGMLPFLFLLFPTGHLVSRRWRPVAWIAGVDLAVLVAGLIVYVTAHWAEPFEAITEELPAVLLVPLLVLVAVFLASFASVVVRYRRSLGDERLQLKWFVTAAALVALSFVLAIPSDVPAIFFLSTLALLLLYASIAIAVLMYRLYEIDVVISKALVYGTLAVFITVVYVGLVVGVGAAVGQDRSPWLSALAAAIVAVAFQPVRQWARRLANRVVYGRRATPYEVLSDFSERIAGAYLSEDVLPRMAQIVAAGTGAARATVWLRVGNELEARASSNGMPSEPVLSVAGEALPMMPDGDSAFPVEHQGSLLGAISVRMPPGEPLSSAQERLIGDVASQAGLVLSNARLIEELRASRQRLVTAQDQERRKLERNIHDGAQQQLVALSVKQRLVENLIERNPVLAREMLSQIQADTTDALETLRDLARGIYPPLLADQGLAAALSAQGRKSPFPVRVDADGVGRYPQEVEAAVYFCALEALQNVAKYAAAQSSTVRLRAGDHELTFEVTDDGRGFDPADGRKGTGLQNMADRLAALGGSLDVRSVPGRGTTVAGRMPAEPLTA